jgi:phosphoserine phosphatase RsbU/P
MVSEKSAIASTSRKFRLGNVLVVPFVLQIMVAVGCIGYLSYLGDSQ